jgi:hypothetical protein|tara:strand:- start:11 stop:211 length:201 start_codon:yes stop_codon:yes gene_type:complete
MKFTELEIAGMLQDNQDTIYELKARITELEEFKNHLQREEDMQKTIDAFAEINAECEAERKEEEEQ